MPGTLPPPAVADDAPLLRGERRDLSLQVGVLVGVILACAYGFTLAPTIWAGDAGELITAVYTLGVPHAPGYPLFTLLGYGATHLPLGPDPAWRLNAFTALCALLTCLAVYRLLLRRHLHPVFAGVIALGVGAGPTFWANAVVAEVYTLNLLLLVLFWTALAQDLETRTFRLSTWFWAGLACVGHQTSLLAAITGLVVLYQTVPKAARKDLVPRALFGILLPCSLYLYTLLAAQRTAALVWGHPDRIGKWLQFTLLPASNQARGGSFWTHLSYLGELLFGEVWGNLLGLTNHAAELGLPILLALIGLGVALKERTDPVIRAWAWMVVVYVATFLLFLWPTPTSLPKLDPYYLPVWILLWLLVPRGYQALLESQAASPTRQHLGPLLKPVLELLLVLGVLITGGQSALATNRSNDTLVRDSYTAMLQGAPRDAVLLCSLDDLFVCWYLQRVEGMRPDVIPVLAYFPATPMEEYWAGWIYDDLAREHPELAIDRDRTRDPQTRLKEYIAAVRPERPVLISFYDPGYGGQFYAPFDFRDLGVGWMPQQLSWRAVTAADELSGSTLQGVAAYYLRGPQGVAQYTALRKQYHGSYEQGYLLVRYMTGLVATAQVLAPLGDEITALELYLRAIALEPALLDHYPPAVDLAIRANQPDRALALQGQFVALLWGGLDLQQPVTVEVWAEESVRLAEMQEPSAALLTLSEVLRVLPDFPPARTLQGRLAGTRQ